MSNSSMTSEFNTTLATISESNQPETMISCPSTCWMESDNETPTNSIIYT